MSPVPVTDSKRTRMEERANLQKQVDERNATITGKGLREFVGATKGKTTSLITYKAFDTEHPETLPSDMKEFVSLIGGVKDEAEILGYAIDGYNAAAYSEAADEIGEFIPDTWNNEDGFVTQFRTAVRNYSKATKMSIEDSVKLMLPGFEQAWKNRPAKAA